MNEAIEADSEAESAGLVCDYYGRGIVIVCELR